MKKEKNKKKTKKKKHISKFNYLKYCIITIILVCIGVAIYFFLTAEDDRTNLTILEKRWIMQNSETLIDINMPNNLDILASNGEGVLFDFLTNIEEDTELSFNKKSYEYPTSMDNLNGLSILVLDNTNKILETDVLIAEDSYVLISNENNYISDLDEIYNQRIGVLTENSDIIKQSLGESLNYRSYSSIQSLITAVKGENINYAIVPRYYALNQIATNDLYINYTFNNLTNKIVLRMPEDERLSSIMTKYLESFKTSKYMESYENNFLKFYLDSTETSDIEARTLSSEVYTYGYLKDNIYSIKRQGNLYGYAGEYINLLANMANMDIEYKEYSNEEELQNAINNNEVDIAFIDFDYENSNGKYTVNAFAPKLVALSKTNYLITNKEGLQNRKLYTLDSTYLKKYIEENYNSVLKTVSQATSNIPEDGILVLDEIEYYYNISNGNLGNYYTLLKDDYNASYRFFIQNDKEALYNLMNFTLMYSDSNDIEMNSINNLMRSGTIEDGFRSLYLIVVLIIVVPVIILFALVAFAKTRKNIKILRKEDVLKYNDMLTSLKNRNYLRAHIDEWDEAKIVPRTIIMVDLNNLKYVNDNYGQEEGNMLIKKAAAILINTQLEKSEIIRTDGNEFLIYLIGYNKTQVNTYIGKLSREFEKLPHGFGAAIGYSMIEDEIKTIDDAINEASIEMRLDKEQNYK